MKKNFEPKDCFGLCMGKVLDCFNPNENSEIEDVADRQLLLAANSAMALKLYNGKRLGRYGWWNSNVCSIDDLRKMRDKAIDDNDHSSVLNFTAMIAMRESLIK